MQGNRQVIHIYKMFNTKYNDERVTKCVTKPLLFKPASFFYIVEAIWFHAVTKTEKKITF